VIIQLCTIGVHGHGYNGVPSTLYCTCDIRDQDPTVVASQILSIHYSDLLQLVVLVDAFRILTVNFENLNDASE
jgi:hypothetical protein